MKSGIPFGPRTGATVLAMSLAAAVLFAADEPIDWGKAQALHRRAQRGESLAPDEQAYYERAKALLRQGRGPATQVRPPAPPPWTNHLTPLTELGTERYHGQDGGLYGGGRNDAPAGHAAAARHLAAEIRALDATGEPSPTGKIGLLSVGMSNTTMEFSRFKAEADRDPSKRPAVVIVDAAQGGQTATAWANREAPLWRELDRRLERADLAPPQVQVVWLKQAEAGPARLGEFPAHTQTLQAHLVTALQLLRAKFPNLRLAYLSSRIYAGYAVTALNPEPFAYESAFAVRGLIQDQIRGEPELNFDPARGAVKSPLLLWGPYLWADGLTPRKQDGLIWERADVAGDGTHPSATGSEKVAQMLLRFFKTDPTARAWFAVKPAERPAQ